MVDEATRQLRDEDIPPRRPAIREMACSTTASLREMILPGVLVMGTPIFLGVVIDLGSSPACSPAPCSRASCWPSTMANTGGAWDNAKKMIEGGLYGGKGSDAHKAAVTGDTVGDPFKDTAGPSLNILIKLISVVAVVLTPHINVDKAAKAADEAAKVEKAGATDKAATDKAATDKAPRLRLASPHRLDSAELEQTRWRCSSGASSCIRRPGQISARLLPCSSVRPGPGR